MPGESILVVDRDPSSLEFCTRILEQQGYHVKAAGSGRQAVEFAQSTRFDLILSDLTTSAQDGVDAVRAIKETDPSTAGVVISDHRDMRAGVDALRRGMDDLVVKPFSPRELREAVSSTLAKGRTQRENVRLRALIPLYELSKIFMGVTNLDLLLTEIVNVCCQETGAERASLMLLNEGGHTLTIHAARGLPKDVMETTRIELGEGIAGRVAERREALVLDDSSPPSAEFAKLMKQDQISSAISIPLIVREKLIGILNLSKLGHVSSPFTAGSLELASVLAGQAAIAIENARLFEETERAYRELKKLDELKGEFINVASHELRTPLAILLGYASLLDEQATDTAKKHTQAIIHSALHLKKLVTDMLSLRYLQAGEMELELQLLEVADVTQKVVEELGFLAKDKGQTLTVDVPQDMPSIWADEGMLYLIISNLVSNAIKFTPQGGTIKLMAVTGEDELTVSVEDSGIGIVAKEFDNVFGSFYQVGNSLRREYPGLGLGLSIVRELVELHQGKVWVQSTVDRGSTFIFTISRHLAAQLRTAQESRKDN
jgi:signal transduction histidine kinase